MSTFELMKNHHLVYKITNNLNDKYYIGIHSTDCIEDGYMGSGNLIKRAIEKDGSGNFTKEILFNFNTRGEALKKERRLVGKKQIKSRKCYNLVVGGGSPLNLTRKAKTPKTIKSIIAPKFAKFDEKYRYVFKSNETSLYKYKVQIALIHDCFYKKISEIFIEMHAGACDMLTNTYNNRYTHKEATNLLKVYQSKNLMGNFIITKEQWLTN